MNLRLSLPLMIGITFLLSSCVVQDLKKTKADVKQLQSEKKDLQAAMELEKKRSIQENERLKHQLDTLSGEVAKWKALSPKELAEKSDSLQKVVILLQGQSGDLQAGNRSLADTLRQFKSQVRSLYSLPDNQAKQVAYKGNTFDCYVVDTKKSDIQFYWKDKSGKPVLSLKKLGEMVAGQQENLFFATNGGMYKPDNSPQGLFIQNGKALIPIDRRREEYGNFYMQPNGLFILDNDGSAKLVKTEDFDDKIQKSVKFATQSGPMVVIDGTINPKFKVDSDNLNIRSGVGINEEGKVIFIISNQRVSFYDFASVFKTELKCPNALYLDGAISEMYLPELGRLQNGGNFGPIIGVTKKK